MSEFLGRGHGGEWHRHSANFHTPQVRSHPERRIFSQDAHPISRLDPRRTQLLNQERGSLAELLIGVRDAADYQ